jgi:hypothetical protein
MTNIRLYKWYRVWQTDLLYPISQLLGFLGEIG